MDNTNSKSIAKLQDNLMVIRKIAGWTTQELGDRIGVTKQTISNLENKKTLMTLTQYIAIRSILDYEIQTNKENTALAQVVEILLNQEQDVTEEERKKISKGIEIIAAAAAGGASGAALAAASTTLFSAVGVTLGAPVALAVGSAVWMPKLINKITKNKK